MYIHHVAKPMVRKQIYLTVDLDQRLRREARRQSKSEAEVLREALAARLGGSSATDLDPEDDSLWGLVGAGASAATDLSERVDEVLYGTGRGRR